MITTTKKYQRRAEDPTSELQFAIVLKFDRERIAFSDREIAPESMTSIILSEDDDFLTNSSFFGAEIANGKIVYRGRT